MDKVKFIMNTESTGEHVIEGIYEVLDVLDWLSRDDTSFITVRSQPLVQNTTFMQAACNIDKKTGSAVYQIEVQVRKDNGVLTQYRLETENPGLMEKMFTDYIEKQKTPDLSAWKDVTAENPFISQANAKILAAESSPVNFFKKIWPKK